jgi:hypothetical protein
MRHPSLVWIIPLLVLLATGEAGAHAMLDHATPPSRLKHGLRLLRPRRPRRVRHTPCWRADRSASAAPTERGICSDRDELERLPSGATGAQVFATAPRAAGELGACATDASGPRWSKVLRASRVRTVGIESAAVPGAAWVPAAEEPVLAEPLSQKPSEIAVSRRAVARRTRRTEVMDRSPSRAARLR